MIGIIDYGVGNVGSLRNALTHLGIESVLSHNPDELLGCRELILPGVGAFRPAMKKLESFELVTFLHNWAAKDRPLLGICLGMQLLMSVSEEDGITEGLDIIPGKVVKINSAPRSIHIGWNMVTPNRPSALLPTDGYAYFVHSFACQPASTASIIGATTYGIKFASMIRHGSMIGVQFHPEKSQEFGLAILKRFAHGII